MFDESHDIFYKSFRSGAICNIAHRDRDDAVGQSGQSRDQTGLLAFLHPSAKRGNSLFISDRQLQTRIVFWFVRPQHTIAAMGIRYRLDWTRTGVSSGPDLDDIGFEKSANHLGHAHLQSATERSHRPLACEIGEF